MQGSVSLEQAKLQSIPFMQKLAAFPGFADMVSISLDTAKSDLAYEQGTYTFSNLELSKTGKMAVGDSFTIHVEGHLDGALKLGLPEGMTNLWTKLREDVFNISDRGYAWADVKIVGTPGQWDEDGAEWVQAQSREVFGEQG